MQKTKMRQILKGIFGMISSLVLFLGAILWISGCGGGGGNGGGATQTLTTITITPTSATVVSEAAQISTVKGYDQNGAEMSFTPVFTVNPSKLGTVTLSGQNGIFTAVTKGTGTIKVTGGNNITATASIEVATGPLNSLVLSPTSVTLNKEQKQQFTVYGVDGNGNAKAKKFITVSPTWFVIGSIGTIDNNGLFTATNQGTGQVKATATKEDGTQVSITATIVTLLPKPNPPTVLPSKAGGKKVTLSWTPPTTRADSAATALLPSEISGYYVYYSTTQGSFDISNRILVYSPIITIVLDQSNSIVKENNITYYFAVSTLDTETPEPQEGAQSSLVSATPFPSSPPKSPVWTKVCAANITNITTGAVDDPNCSLYPKSSEVQLTWNAVTVHKDGTCYKDATGCTFSAYEDLLSGYKVYRTASTTLVTDRSKYAVVQTVAPQAGQTVMYSDKTVTNGTTYFYYVRALNDEGTESDLPVDNTDILGTVKPQLITGRF